MAEIPPSGRGLRICELWSNEENVAGLRDGRLIRYVIRQNGSEYSMGGI